MSRDQWIVYALKDPRTGEIRYVGWTGGALEKRLQKHMADARRRSTKRDLWIRTLQADALHPIAVVLERDIGEWASVERKWIAYYRALGCSLTNETAGGEGTPGVIRSAEYRAKISHAARNRTKEHRDLLALASRGRRHTSEAREKMSKKKSGRAWSTARRQADIAAGDYRAGRTHTADAKAKISAKKKGVPKTPEHRAKLAEAARRQWQEGKFKDRATPEYRKKLAQAIRNHYASKGARNAA